MILFCQSAFFNIKNLKICAFYALQTPSATPESPSFVNKCK